MQGQLLQVSSTRAEGGGGGGGVWWWCVVVWVWAAVCLYAARGVV